jgi:hypothetical protein
VAEEEEFPEDGEGDAGEEEVRGRPFHLVIIPKSFAQMAFFARTNGVDADGIMRFLRRRAARRA